MTAKRNVATDKEELSFEEALERLETVVKEMEGGDLGLDALIARFEEGQKMIAFCDRKLNEVDRRIEMLVKKGDRVEVQPFDAETDDGSGAGTTSASGSVPF
jgi:exodeoxyribonuclease VII small subunit